MSSTSTDPAPGFGTAFGLGMLVPVLTGMAAGFAGGSAVVGVVAFAVLAIGAVTLGPPTAQRVIGVVLGALTTCAVAFGFLIVALANADF